MKNCTFIRFMAAPRPTLGHYRDSLIHPMGRGYWGLPQSELGVDANGGGTFPGGCSFS